MERGAGSYGYEAAGAGAVRMGAEGVVSNREPEARFWIEYLRSLIVYMYSYNPSPAISSTLLLAILAMRKVTVNRFQCKHVAQDPSHPRTSNPVENN